MDERLLQYFSDELEQFHAQSAHFAETHPKIAGRLRLSADAIDDPHTARLVESFALIASRLRLKLDDDFPELTETVLDYLSPHALAPLPSFSIIQIAPPEGLEDRQTIARGTEIFSEPVANDICRFTTTQAIDLWPIRVESATLSEPPFLAPHRSALDAAGCLRLVLSCSDPEQTFTDLAPSSLRFFLRAPWHRAAALHELLTHQTMAVALADHPEDHAAVFLGPESIRGCGFEDDEALLPPAPRVFPGYRLLSEFLSFPDKFLFCNLSGLEAKCLRGAGNRLEVFFYLRRFSADVAKVLTAETFALGCTPVVNLFRQRAEPIALTHDVAEYPVVPDARHAATREVYAVTSAYVTDGNGTLRPAVPFFGRSPGTSASLGKARVSYQEKRRPHPEIGHGTDCFLSLVDEGYDPRHNAEGVLSLETLCLNRDLPTRLPYGGGNPKLTAGPSAGETGKVKALAPFTPPVSPPRNNGALWRLLSSLSLNHLSLGEGRKGAEALKDLLRLYERRNSPDLLALIDAIVEIEHRRSTARLPEGGLARGIDIILTVDSQHVSPEVLHLFGCVLDRFFGLYVSLNAFARLTLQIKGQAIPYRRWPPRSGILELL